MSQMENKVQSKVKQKYAKSKNTHWGFMYVNNVAVDSCSTDVSDNLAGCVPSVFKSVREQKSREMR
jgi:hypothetical protein